MKVSSHNEWGKLKSIVVGTATGANWPVQDPIFAKNWETTLFKEMPHPRGPVPQHVIDEANEDLDNLTKVLQSAGITVHRPVAKNFADSIRTTNWMSDQMYAYCPRDTHLIVGNTVIEAPMVYRARQMEHECLAHVRAEAIRAGANWISAPRPTLTLDTVSISDESLPVLDEREPIFDAANCLRLDDDILYLKSSSGNALGAQWLQRVLGKDKKVHLIDNVYAYAHIDSTFAPIRPGLVVFNGNRVDEHTNCPDVFKGWDIINFMHPAEQSYYQYPYASKWIGMNLLMVDTHTAIVDKSQTWLIRELENRNVEVWALELRHARTLGGGFHCVTLDLARE